MHCAPAARGCCCLLEMPETQPSPSSRDFLVAIRDYVAVHCKIDELREFCFDIGVPDEEIFTQNATLRIAAKNLIKWLRDRGRLGQLVQWLRKVYGDEEWQIGMGADVWPFTHSNPTEPPISSTGNLVTSLLSSLGQWLVEESSSLPSSGQRLVEITVTVKSHNETTTIKVKSRI